MSVRREFLAGDTDRFAFKVSFQRDPENGRGAPAEESLSWGGFQLWVAGQNLCRHLDESEESSSVHWYLLPLLEWFVDHWDHLLHEERLPVCNSGEDAWSSLEATSFPPPHLSDEASEKWEDAWYAWWTRHSLIACRQGGLFPDLVIRRWRNQIEVSWGPCRTAGQPAVHRFLCGRGFYRADPKSVALALHDVLRGAAEYLVREMPDSERLRRLQHGVASLGEPRVESQLALLAGLEGNSTSPTARWRDVSKLVASVFAGKATEVLNPTLADNLVITSGADVALMFGAVSPAIGDSDVRQICENLAQFYGEEMGAGRLAGFVSAVPLESSDQRPWEQGYALAESLLEKLHLPGGSDDFLDVEHLCRRLSVEIQRITLQDDSTRAVAIAGRRFRPGVLLNATHRTARWNSGRRFTLAHELCHLLHDRGYGIGLATVSGPWAPKDVERRANAFAAMLLMPPALVNRLVRKSVEPVESAAGVYGLARQMRTSFTATLEHLTNLGVLRESARDDIRAEADRSVLGLEAED